MQLIHHHFNVPVLADERIYHGFGGYGHGHWHHGGFGHFGGFGGPFGFGFAHPFYGYGAYPYWY